MEHKGIRLSVASAILCLVHTAWGQTDRVDFFNGEIHADSPAFVHGTVTLLDLRSRNMGSAEVRADGFFSFRSIPCGEYRLIVFDDAQNELYEELVSVQQQNVLLTVQLTDRGPARPPLGPVAVDELLHPPAKKAVNAFLAARKSSQAGNHAKASEQLQEAVRISPDFARAWVNLSAQHIHMGQYDQALQELSHAAEITKLTAPILGNMAFAQYGLHRQDEAMKSARQALLLDSSYGPAHYLLGCVLANDARTLPEAVKHLEVAARTMPSAEAMLEHARTSLRRNVALAQNTPPQ